MMTESRAKPKAKLASRASLARQPAAKATRTANAGAKSKPGAEAQRAIGKEASRLIDERIGSLGDWRAETLAEVRRMIHEGDPDIIEEWKWMGTPVWSHAGNVC